MSCFGHVKSNDSIVKKILEGKVEGKRGRGRPAMTYIDNIKKDSGLSLSQIVRRSEDRDDWRSVVAKAGAANFEHGDADRWQVSADGMWVCSPDSRNRYFFNDLCDR